MMAQSKRDFDNYWMFTQTSVRVKYHDTLEYDSAPEDIHIVDELDWHLYKDPEAAKKHLENRRVIGLTATLGDKNYTSLEARAARIIGFKVCDFWPKEATKPVEPFFDYPMDALDVGKLYRAIKQTLEQHQPVLLYCEKEWLDALQKKGLKAICIDPDSSERLPDVMTKKDGGRYQFFAATDERAMRGTNLRAPDQSINLIVAKSFSSRREMKQGLLRVGRYYDPCLRQNLSHIKSIDEAEELKLNQRLFEFTQTHGNI